MELFIWVFLLRSETLSHKDCGPGYIQPRPQNTEGGYEREIDQIPRAHNYIIIIYNVK